MVNKTALNNQIIDFIFDIARFIKSGMSYESGNNLTLHQLHTLIYIAKQKEVRMIDIAQNFSITKPTATVLINSLVRNGYLRRVIGKKDKREIKVSLAKKGRKFLTQAKDYRSAKITQILSYISTEDKRQLIKILQTIIDKVKEKYAD